MRIVFVTKKKRKKYIELIHKFINKSMLSYDFNLEFNILFLFVFGNFIL